MPRILTLALLLWCSAAHAQSPPLEPPPAPDELEPPPAPASLELLPPPSTLEPPPPPATPTTAPKRVVAVSPPVKEPPKATERVWYGWLTLAVDAASLLMLAGGASSEEDGFAGLGTFGLLLGVPIVHWGYGEIGRGFGSLGLRLLAGSLMILGIVKVVSENSRDGAQWLIAGSVLGIATPFIDAFALAWTERESSPPAKERNRAAASLRVFAGPTAAMDGVRLGVAGAL